MVPAATILDTPHRLWYGQSLSPQRLMSDFEQLFTIAPVGFVVLDQQARVESLNPAASRLLGLDPAVAVGQPLLALLPHWQETGLGAQLPALLEPHPSGEPLLVDVTGLTQQRLRMWAAPISNGPVPSQILLSLTERTEMAALEGRLQRSEYHASIGKIARGIAHELNSPLDGVLRYTQLALEHQIDDSPVREYLLHVKEGLDRMVRAVRAFLEFSRQVTTPVTRVAHLHQLIDDALVLVRHRLKFQQIHLITQLEEALPSVIDGGLQPAIVNLVKNACDAMPRGGTLTITTRAHQTQVEMEIHDTGCGIPDACRARIFEPFFSTKAIHQGTGLGLAIAKEAVTRSGGTIEFTSHEGAGTTFRMRLPVASAGTLPVPPIAVASAGTLPVPALRSAPIAVASQDRLDSNGHGD